MDFLFKRCRSDIKIRNSLNVGAHTIWKIRKSSSCSSNGLFFWYQKRAIMKMFIQLEFEKENLLIQGSSGTKICCRSPFIIIFYNYQSCGFYSIEPWLVNHCWKFSRDPKIVLIFSSKVVTQGPSRKCTFSSASNSLRPSFAFLKHLNEWKYCWTFTLNQM